MRAWRTGSHESSVEQAEGDRLPIPAPSYRGRVRRRILITVGVVLFGFGAVVVAAPVAGYDAGRSCGSAPLVASALGLDTAAPGDGEWCRSEGLFDALFGLEFLLPGALLLWSQWRRARRARREPFEPPIWPRWRRILVTVGALLVGLGALIVLTPTDGADAGRSCGSAPSVAMALGLDTAAPGDGEWCRSEGQTDALIGTLVFLLPAALLLACHRRRAGREPFELRSWTPPRSPSRTRRRILITVGILLVGFGALLVLAPTDGAHAG